MQGTMPEVGPADGGVLWLRRICLVAALLAPVPGLHLLSRIWNQSDYLAHGYLIPLVSCGLLWHRRQQILEALHNGPVPTFGPLLVCAAALLEAAAVAAEASTLAGLGIPLLLGATAYAVGGGPLLRAADVPLGFLILMTPPPGALLDPLLLALKAFVVSFSVGLLQVLGQPVASLGNRILVPGHELFVADACSGLISVVTLLPLAVVIAYFFSHGTWRRIALIAATVPLAVLGNMVRVIGTVLLVSRFGVEYAEGALHESFGLLTSLLGTGMLILIARWIE